MEESTFVGCFEGTNCLNRAFSLLFPIFHPSSLRFKFESTTLESSRLEQTETGGNCLPLRICPICRSNSRGDQRSKEFTSSLYKLAGFLSSPSLLNSPFLSLTAAFNSLYCKTTSLKCNNVKVSRTNSTSSCYDRVPSASLLLFALTITGVDISNEV
jgi:hypothetical protein